MLGRRSGQQLTYKATWYGCRVMVASRWEPSSKTCSQCGWEDEHLTLADRVFRGQNPECGLALDRDLNAAINLARLAGSSPERQNACGEESADQGHKALVKRSPLKQEPDAFDASA
jgi:putative transposase